MQDSEIKYDGHNRDYAVYVYGVLVGYARTYKDAEDMRTAALAKKEVRV